MSALGVAVFSNNFLSFQKIWEAAQPPNVRRIRRYIAERTFYFRRINGSKPLVRHKNGQYCWTSDLVRSHWRISVNKQAGRYPHET